MKSGSSLFKWLTLGVGSFVSLSATPAEVGDTAPDFSLAGSDGRTHTLADYRGRHVVLAFFPKAFTGG